jgi:hypothetical protein
LRLLCAVTCSSELRNWSGLACAAIPTSASAATERHCCHVMHLTIPIRSVSAGTAGGIRRRQDAYSAVLIVLRGARPAAAHTATPRRHTSVPWQMTRPPSLATRATVASFTPSCGRFPQLADAARRDSGMLKHEGVPITRRPRRSPDRRACCGTPAARAVIGSEPTSLIPVPARPCSQSRLRFVPPALLPPSRG